MASSAGFRSPDTSAPMPPSSPPLEGENLGTYTVRCHCGRISGRFLCDRTSVTAWDCNCTDCSMRRNVHIIVPSSRLTLTMGKGEEGGSLEDASILYRWGTGVAERRFCRTCGVLPFYVPRSNPDGVAITVACCDFGGDRGGPEVTVKQFDGRNWERSYAAAGIAAESESPSES